MALIKFGGGVVQMSGSIAGTTFARNRYGNYARARTKPTNPNTASQQAVRSAMAYLTSRWAQDLIAAQRTAWNLYGSNVVMTNKLGESMNLSGFNHYIRSNTFLRRNGVAAIDAGPVIFEIPEGDPQFSIAVSEATQLIALTFNDAMAWCSEDGAYMEIYQGKPQNAQRNFFDGPWKQCIGLVGDSGAPVTSPTNKECSFVSTAGQHIWVYARIRRADGRVSQPFRSDVLCGA